MNRRNFLQLSGLLPIALIPQKAHAETFENGLVFPFYFQEEQQIKSWRNTPPSLVTIAEFKKEGFFSQIWHELLQLIK